MDKSDMRFDEVVLGAQNDGAYFETLRPSRLHLDYVGPGGSFAGQTYSFSDLLEGKIGQDKLRDKYALIGATAAALGDRLATPFTYAENDPGLRADGLTPGIEILANLLSTILRIRFTSCLTSLRRGIMRMTITPSIPMA